MGSLTMLNGTQPETGQAVQGVVDHRAQVDGCEVSLTPIFHQIGLSFSLISLLR